MKYNSKYVAPVTIVILFFTVLLHLGILLKMIPYKNAWGGRLSNDREMYTFESISIGLNVFLLWVICIKVKYTKQLLPGKFIQAVLWIFFALFLLNTVGNLLAKTMLEKLFALVTLYLAYLLWKIIHIRPANG